MNGVELHCGDALEVLKTLPDGAAQCCVTSPPYFGLRDYGVDGQIGLEPTPEAYIAKLVGVFREVRRVLRDDGVLWLNLGDSYNGSGPSGGAGKQYTNIGSQGTTIKNVPGLKTKDLLGIPWSVAFALRADGWYLRSDIIWHKPNPMPESVTDRPTKSHEYIFLLAKRERYFYDAAAIAEESERAGTVPGGSKYSSETAGVSIGGVHTAATLHHAAVLSTRNRRTVWTVTTTPYPEAHFATFPEKLIEPCILAGSAEGDTILDPFAGSGTTLAVAVKHGRRAIGVELNREYHALIRKRLAEARRVRDHHEGVGTLFPPEPDGNLFDQQEAA